MENYERDDRQKQIKCTYELFYGPDNSDYPCRKCPYGKPMEKAYDCRNVCMYLKSWVGQRLRNARKVVYGTEEVQEIEGKRAGTDHRNSR